ncbi:acyl-CoA oxidase [[Emmonsia] crescens]|uniref:Acyl-coenzyme A oxidase n=1 Tax=[Emmonsia] crescens TaxID=73230 RepID=A0A2B7ZB99_9EURO|nr:acyl-CoA oxidase [Emmonsia crescens]
MASQNRQQILMQKARQAATFDPYKLTCILHNGEETAKKRREAFRRVEEAMGTADQSKLPAIYANTEREAIYLQGVEAGTAAFVDGIRYSHDFFYGLDQRYTLSNCTPYGLHYMMFIPTIELQGSIEQIEYWVPVAKQGKICGCYCQTELAHGTFVRGIETTATLDTDNDEFIVNSPTLTSAKFWPGAMASSCTHGILMARLVIREKDHGVHPFIIPLRNVDNFKPVQGVEFGDLGMKMGYNGTTNGYALFSGLRIPRNHLLMGHAKVHRDGTYVPAPHDKTAYLTMLHARSTIAAGAGFKLAQAATIATRYSVVREQGAGISDGSEMSIIHHRSQNFRLFTIIARTYAIHFTRNTLGKLEKGLKHISSTHDYSSMGLDHVLLAGFKAWNTQVAADGAEDARKSCGGHGFVLTSGLPSIVAEATAPATFEGENYVMYQQVGRYLLKCWKNVKMGKQIDSRLGVIREAFTRLQVQQQEGCKASRTEFLNPNIQCAIFSHRAFRLLNQCSEFLENAERKGESAADAFNNNLMEIIAAARAYIELLVLQDFINGVESTRATDPAIYAALSRLRSLFALTTITHPQSYDAISFVEDQHLNASQMRDIRHCINDLLDELLPDAIALTDGWDFTDASLCSAIGQYDGNVYETLMSWTRQMPINRGMERGGGTCEEAWIKWIKPALSPELRGKL